MENVDIAEGYRSICGVCGAPIISTDYLEGKQPFRSFGLGDAPDTACVFGIVMFCPAHIEEGNPLAVVRRLAGPYAGQITAALAQWDLPDGTNCPVFCYGTIQYDDGRLEARIVPIDSVEPLYVPVEQVALYRPPST